MELTEKQINFYKQKEYYIFGSENSTDIDAIIFVDELPSVDECKKIAYYFKNELNLNLNLCVLRDGIIIESAKGSPDEVNNSLYSTFKYHYKHNGDKVNPVTRTVERDVPLKICRAIRIILSLISKSCYRPKIKEALSSYDFNKRVQVLSEVNFNNIPDEILTKDILKSISFQIGQCIGLINEKEFYTKSEICKFVPELVPFLNRWDLDDRRYYFQGLHEALNDLLAFLDNINSSKIDNNSPINIFKVNNNFISDKDYASTYSYLKPFDNKKIDLKKEKTISDN